MRQLFIGLAFIFLVISPLSASARDLGAVVIDPGHGGFDSGLSNGPDKEKDIALNVSKKIKSFLKGQGVRAFLTREVDRHLSFADRRAQTDRQSPGVLVSIHMSDSESATVYVAWYKKMEADLSLEEYYSLESKQRRYIYESRLLASAIGDALGREFGVHVNYRELPLPILSETGAPAVLIEIPSRGVKYDEESLQRFAYSLGIGIQLYGQK